MSARPLAGSYVCKSEKHEREKVRCDSCKEERKHLKKTEELLETEKDRLLRLAKERSEQKARIQAEGARLQTELAGLMQFYVEQEARCARDSLSDTKLGYFAGRRVHQD